MPNSGSGGGSAGQLGGVPASDCSDAGRLRCSQQGGSWCWLSWDLRSLAAARGIRTVVGKHAGGCIPWLAFIFVCQSRDLDVQVLEAGTGLHKGVGVPEGFIQLLFGPLDLFTAAGDVGFSLFA